MKVIQIHKALRLVLDKNASGVDFGGCPAFLPQELDFFLNLAYLEVISNKVNGTVTLRDFESNSKRIADLQKLIKTDHNLDLTYTVSNIAEYNGFSEGDRWLCVDMMLHFNDGEQAPCVAIDHATARKFLKTHTNHPYIETPVATIEDDVVRVYVDTYTMIPPYTLDITYLKKPTAIDSSEPDQEIDEVPESVIHEVINRAAVLALENIESLRTQGKVQLNTLEE